MERKEGKYGTKRMKEKKERIKKEGRRGKEVVEYGHQEGRKQGRKEGKKRN